MNKIIYIIWAAVRPFYRLWARLFRPMTLGVRGLVFDGAGRVLLVRHGYTPGWYFPGGGVDSGETGFDSIKRELAEEAGVLLKSRPRLIGLYANFKEFRSDHIAFYLIEAGQYDLVIQKSLEIAEYKFFAPDALPDGVTRATRARLEEFWQGMPTPDFW